MSIIKSLVKRAARLHNNGFLIIDLMLALIATGALSYALALYLAQVSSYTARAQGHLAQTNKAQTDFYLDHEKCRLVSSVHPPALPIYLANDYSDTFINYLYLVSYQTSSAHPITMYGAVYEQ